MSDEIYYDEDRNVIPMPLEEWKKQRDGNTEEKIKIVDCNNNELHNGDNVVAIKSLPVKSGTDIKKGEKFTNITLTDEEGMITARHARNGKMYLKTEFFKKA